MNTKAQQLRDLAQFCEDGDSGTSMANQLRDLANYIESLEGSCSAMAMRIDRQARLIASIQRLITGAHL